MLAPTTPRGSNSIWPAEHVKKYAILGARVKVHDGWQTKGNCTAREMSSMYSHTKSDVHASKEGKGLLF